MKTIYHLLVFICLLSGYAKAQNPYIADITVLPNNPTEDDIVQIAVNIQTGNPSKKISITPMLVGNDIHIHACYGLKSMAGQVYIFKDTLTIGKLPDGLHKIIVKAYQGTDTNSCLNLFDSSTRTDTFEILPLMPITQQILPQDITENDSVKIAITVLTPNPAKKILLTHNVLQNKVTISGCFAKTQPSAIAQLFTDTVTVGKLSEGEYQSVFTAYYSDGPDTNICNMIIDSTQIADSFTVTNGLVINSFNLQKGMIYPNPASERVLVSLPDGLRIEQMILLDVSGRVVNKSNDARLAIEELPAGLYILQVQTSEGRFVQKLQKE